MKELKIVLLSLIISIFSACGDTNCPAFPPKLLDYLPYNTNDALKFKNYRNDTLTLNIIETNASDSYSFSWSCKCVCEASASFKTDCDSINSLKIIGVIGLSDNNNAYLNYYFYEASSSHDEFIFYKIIENPFSEGEIEAFGDTIAMEKEEYRRVGKVVVVRNKGIVEFWDKKEDCNWILIK